MSVKVIPGSSLIAVAVMEIEEGRTVLPGQPAAICQNGQRYEEIKTDRFNDQNACVADFMLLLRKFVGDAQTIYWRRRPEIVLERGKFQAYCRLAVE